jgi:3-oxoadipate enol-lactonase
VKPVDNTELATCSVDGVKLAYRVSGAAGSPPLVALHALGETGASWAPVTDVLAGQFRVYALDLRGHGASDWPGSYSFQLMFSDIAGWLDQLKIGPVTLIGHSLGGIVSFLLAMRRPDLISALIIEDVAPPYQRDRPIPERPDDFAADFDWEVVPAFGRAGNVEDSAMWAGLAGITAPTLLIGGGPESSVPEEQVARVAAAIPDCSLVTIPAGHFVHNAKPAEFLAAVLAWLPVTSGPSA